VILVSSPVIHRVKATREGLVGGKTASGFVIDKIVPFVALPAHNALYNHVIVRNPRNGKACIACVLDVGPWNTADEAYVFRGARPAAEAGTSLSGHGTNNAGIDLGEAVWQNLGMAGNDDVEWAFVSPGDAMTGPK
jgi:hypothetical protein